MVLGFGKSNLVDSNTISFEKKVSKTSVPRRYFGSNKKLSKGISQARFSERPLQA